MGFPHSPPPAGAAVFALLLAAALPADPPPAAPPAAGGDGAQQEAPAGPAGLPEGLTEPQRLSYALGVNVGRSLLADGLDPDPGLFLQGLRDALTDAPVRLTEEELSALLGDAADRVRAAATQARADAAAERAAASRAALDAFLKEPGVTPRATGEAVRFEVTGTGPRPGPEGRVRLHYTARVAGEDRPLFSTRGPDGAEEENGEGAAAPAEAPLAALLPGLRAVLPGVPAGSTVVIGLPADRAYGAAGGPGVPPGAALLVRVELLAVLPPAEDPAAEEPTGPATPATPGDRP